MNVSAPPFNPPQADIVAGGYLDLGFSVAVAMPTGSGKSRIAEEAIDRALAAGETGVYLSPLRALADEKAVAWAARFPSLGIYTGDHDGAPPIGSVGVAVATYERFDGWTRRWREHPAAIARWGVVVVDEAHLLGDRSRGARLEGAIARARRLNPFLRVILLSGTMSNHADLASWLGGVSYHSTWRPVACTHQVLTFRKPAEKEGRIVALVQSSVAEGATVLVFANTRRKAVALAAALEAAGVVVGVHHAGLSSERRRAVEAAFRAGAIACVVATPTLEMGLNLPCSVVIQADDAVWNGEAFEPIAVWRYHQRAGRAGRPGQDQEGKAWLVRAGWARRGVDYARAAPEPVRSQLGTPAALAEQVLVEVTGRFCRTRGHLRTEFLQGTLWHHQEGERAAGRLEACVADLLAGGLLVDPETPTGPCLQATRNGRIAVRHHLSPAAAGFLVRWLARQEEATDFDLLWAAVRCGDCSGIMHLDAEVAPVLAEALDLVVAGILDAPAPEGPAKVLGSALLATWVLWSCAHATDEERAAWDERLGVGEWDRRVLEESAERLLVAMAAFAQPEAAPPGDQPGSEARPAAPGLGAAVETVAVRCQRLALHLRHHLAGEAVLLCLLDGCGGVLAARLRDAGYPDLEAVAEATPADLERIPGIGPVRATAWVEQAGGLLGAAMAQERRSAQVRLPAASVRLVRSAEEDLRRRRAAGLRVSRDGAGWRVWGGADEHRVVGEACDCRDHLDHGAGWMCKHRWAVHLQGVAAPAPATTPATTLRGILAGLGGPRVTTTEEAACPA